MASAPASLNNCVHPGGGGNCVIEQSKPAPAQRAHGCCSALTCLCALGRHRSTPTGMAKRPGRADIARAATSGNRRQPTATFSVIESGGRPAGAPASIENPPRRAGSQLVSTAKMAQTVGTEGASTWGDRSGNATKSRTATQEDRQQRITAEAILPHRRRHPEQLSSPIGSGGNLNRQLEADKLCPKPRAETIQCCVPACGGG